MKKETEITLFCENIKALRKINKLSKINETSFAFMFAKYAF